MIAALHRPAPPFYSRTPVGMALAACVFGLPAELAGNTIELQLTPAGEFRPVDGRELPVSAWRIDATIAARVIERFKARRTPLVIDYEHQTLHAEANGQPAPAAAWIRSIEWREGQGLYATVELTERARQLVAAREYQFFSPVFSFDPTSGEVLEIHMGALTNHPALDGMEPLALRAAATFTTRKETTLDKSITPLLVAVRTALGLAAEANEGEATAALTALGPVRDHAGTLDALRTELGLGDKADGAAIIAACRALKAAKPDPKDYVPIAALTQVQTQLSTLQAELHAGRVDAIIEEALGDGRLLAGDQEQWARDLGQKDLAALMSYLKTAQPIAALNGTQTRGRRPPGASSGDADPVAVATAARKWQTEQAAAGVQVSTAQAVDHVTKQMQGA